MKESALKELYVDELKDLKKAPLSCIDGGAFAFYLPVQSSLSMANSLGKDPQMQLTSVPTVSHLTTRFPRWFVSLTRG